MANFLNHKSVKCIEYIEWVVQAFPDNIVRSETFLLQKCACFLEFYAGLNNESYPSLYFHSDKKLKLSLEVTIRVVSNSTTLDLVTKSINGTEHIWYCGKARKVKSCTFELFFQTLKEDKCIQTEAYKNSNDFIRGLSEDFAKLLETGLDHDVEMKCGGQCIQAHKIVLGTRSEVFKTMFQNDMLEGRKGVVDIIDMDATCFRDFVKYLYTDRMPELTLDEAKVLYEVGDKYDVRGLMFRCAEYLRENLSPENALQCYSLADAHSDEILKDKIKTYLLEEKIYLQDDYWLPFCENFPKLAFEVYRLSHKKVRTR